MTGAMGIFSDQWWRRRESNPGPRFVVQRYRCLSSEIPLDSRRAGPVSFRLDPTFGAVSRNMDATRQGRGNGVPAVCRHSFRGGRHACCITGEFGSPARHQARRPPVSATVPFGGGFLHARPPESPLKGPRRISVAQWRRREFGLIGTGPDLASIRPSVGPGRILPLKFQRFARRMAESHPLWPNPPGPYRRPRVLPLADIEPSDTISSRARRKVRFGISGPTR